VILGRGPINLQGVRLARVRYAPIATKFRSVGKCRDVPLPDVMRSVKCQQVTEAEIKALIAWRAADRTQHRRR
jgi:hypothetical protein